ncbi:MAG: hypothetical protein M3083_00930 [Actinomycetota bacterium]|nr:hypothetical protein [Actinomycetota bacterium]MDQ6946402.1 hypothetical protein [Actinomycetota bacterium]
MPNTGRRLHAELAAAQLADTVERSYERDDLPDWELVFELSRRCLSGEVSEARAGAVGASQQA